MTVSASRAQHVDQAAAALHEAAHAVIFGHLGVRFSRVELFDDDVDGRDGAVFEHPTANGEHPIGEIIGLIAGSMAEHMFTGAPLQDIANTCGQTDFATADQLGAHLDPMAADALLHRAHRLVADKRSAIAHVAAALLQHRQLTEAEVLSMIDDQAR